MREATDQVKAFVAEHQAQASNVEIYRAGTVIFSGGRDDALAWLDTVDDAIVHGEIRVGTEDVPLGNA